jgi:hypothetical protein
MRKDIFQYWPEVRLPSSENQRRRHQQDNIQTRYNHYEFVVVPFGLINAPSNFMCLMNGVFRYYLDKFIIFFLDDIIIYSKMEEHEKHLNMMLQVLKEHQLYANIRKCTFCQRQIHYLGHIVSKEGITVNLENIETIKSCSVPKNVPEVRSFMRLVGYYNIFIEGLSKVANPITFLQKKITKIEWTIKCEDFFQHLKELLTNAPILKVTDRNKYFIVYRCMQGRDRLMQNEHFICYDSRNLMEHEINYATHDLELETIVHALKCGGIILWEENSS